MVSSDRSTIFRSLPYVGADLKGGSISERDRRPHWVSGYPVGRKALWATPWLPPWTKFWEFHPCLLNILQFWENFLPSLGFLSFPAHPGLLEHLQVSHPSPPAPGWLQGRAALPPSLTSLMCVPAALVNTSHSHFCSSNTPSPPWTVFPGERNSLLPGTGEAAGNSDRHGQTPYFPCSSPFLDAQMWEHNVHTDFAPQVVTRMGLSRWNWALMVLSLLELVATTTLGTYRRWQWEQSGHSEVGKVLQSWLLFLC